jgi:maltooligosyltrehalose trehalohydrolase
MNYQSGAFLHDHHCRFTVWAPFRDTVEIIVNDQRTEKMKPLERGYWEVTLDQIKAGDLYKFVLDNDLKRPDPNSLSQPEGVHGPSEVIDRQAFAWTDTSWKGIPMQQMIIYELHVGTFTDEGTFHGVAEKLDYLLELGVNTIEIMPVAQFPGERNWGYDGVYPFAVQDSYGGVEGLKSLVNQCHQKGIAVILDVVYNHMGPEGNYLNDYGPYFTDKYHTPWGKAINFDDAYSDQVRAFFLQNALMWLDEFHIDGLRLDAVHAIKDMGARHFLSELSEAVRKLEESQLRHLPLIAECDLNDAKYISPHSRGGYGLTGQWIDEFHHALHALLTGESNGYYEDFGEFEHIRKAFEKTYVYDGIYSPHRKKTFGSSALGHTYDQFVVFSQNHDQVGNRMMGDRLSKLINFEQQKLSAVAVLTSPYTPMLFMGEEYAEEKPFQYFVSHTDTELVEAVRKGRKAEFAYFHHPDRETPDPQSVETFLNSTLSWDMNTPRRKAMHHLYRKLITIRKKYPAFRIAARQYTQVASQDNALVILRRSSMDDHLTYIILNFEDQTHHFKLKEKESAKFDCILDTSDQIWQGSGATTEQQVQGGKSISIAPFAAVILNKL